MNSKRRRIRRKPSISPVQAHLAQTRPEQSTQELTPTAPETRTSLKHPPSRSGWTRHETVTYLEERREKAPLVWTQSFCSWSYNQSVPRPEYTNSLHSSHSQGCSWLLFKFQSFHTLTENSLSVLRWKNILRRLINPPQKITCRHLSHCGCKVPPQSPLWPYKTI